MALDEKDLKPFIDVLEDYKKDYGTLNQMEKVEEKMVTKYLQNEVAKVVKQVLLK